MVGIKNIDREVLSTKHTGNGDAMDNGDLWYAKCGHLSLGRQALDKRINRRQNMPTML